MALCVFAGDEEDKTGYIFSLVHEVGEHVAEEISCAFDAYTGCCLPFLTEEREGGTAVGFAP